MRTASRLPSPASGPAQHSAILWGEQRIIRIKELVTCLEGSGFDVARRTKTSHDNGRKPLTRDLRTRHRQIDGRLPIASARVNFCWQSLTPTSSFDVATNLSKRGRHRRVRTSPRLPLGATASRVPRSEMSKGAATNGRWQRRFPPVPCRSEQSRQGAERNNDGPHFWFQRRAQIVSTKTY